MYDIAWVKSLCESDLILCNLLSFMRIYHYNLRFETVKKSVFTAPAEAKGITKIIVRLRTKDDNSFNVQYYIADSQADIFIEQLTKYFDERSETSEGRQ